MDQEIFFISSNSVYSALGKLDAWEWRWVDAEIPEGAQEVSGLAALERVLAGEQVRKIPVGVIGPRDATEAQLKTAEAIGTRLGQIGLTMICGGKAGVMSAAAKGCHQAGGLSVGLIPDHDWREANPYIQLPIATGLSEARNLIIAKSCEVLIAIGGSYGTLSEIAFGLHFSKPVIGISGAPEVDGLEFAGSVDDAMERMAGHLLNRVKTS